MVGLFLSLLVGFLTPTLEDPTAARRAEVEETWRKRLEPTQLNVQLVDARGGVRFRASLVGRTEDSLVLLTAAHCVEPDDKGRQIQIARGDHKAVLKATAVSINPWRQPGLPDAIPGSDNAILVVEAPQAGTDEARWLAVVEVAKLVEKPTPGPDGATVPIFAIDQFEKPHMVRAGNFSNPRWLEWGKTYTPIPGDSGSGVFGFVTGKNGELEAILIGVVTDQSPTGGGGSIVAVKDSWVKPWIPVARQKTPAAR